MRESEETSPPFPENEPLAQEPQDAQDQRFDSPQRPEHDWRGSWRANWRADYVLLLYSVPLVFAFNPYTRELAKAGFAILRDDVPVWYVQIGGIMVAGIYGFRKIFNIAELYMHSRSASRKDQD